MSAEIVVLSDYRTAKARRAAKRAGVAPAEFFVGAGFMASLAWLNAMDEAAKLWLVPWPGGIDDMKF